MAHFNINEIIGNSWGVLAMLIADLKVKHRRTPDDQLAIRDQITDELTQHYKRCMGNRSNKSPMDVQGAASVIRGGLEILLKHLSEIETLVEDK